MKQAEIETIIKRNKRVEADKAWENSWSRRLMIAGGTYLIVAIDLLILDVPHNWLHAIVPSGAYLISTLTLPVMKRVWTDKFYKKDF